MQVENFADNDGVKIRYLDLRPAEPSGYPIVFVPGVVDTADEYVEALECFDDRRVLVVEVRGCGGSDAPVEGYSSDHLAGDVRAVLSDSGINAFHLMTFSRGTTAGLRAAFDCPARVMSVAIGDYPAAEIALTDDFADRMSAMSWRGVPNSERMPRHVMEAVQRESRREGLWDRLAALKVPVLVARGPEPGSLLDDRKAERFRKTIPDLEMAVIPGAGHDLFRPVRGAYPLLVRGFISRRLPGT